MAIIFNSTLAVTETQHYQSIVVTQISADVNNLLKNMLGVYNSNMARMWQNADGLTPQQVCDAFGTDAGELFRLAGVLKTAVNAAVAGTIPDATTPTITVNNDGTVSIGS